MEGQKKKKSSFYIDFNLMFLVFFIFCFGLIMLYSASSYTCSNKYGDAAHFLKLQIRNIGFGVVFMVAAMLFNLDLFRSKYVRIGILVFAAFLCLCVHIPGIGANINGSSRWLRLGPFSFQPSELAKPAVIVYLAALFSEIPRSMNQGKNIFRVFAYLAAPIIIVAISNLSTAVIIVGIFFFMLFIVSRNYKVLGTVLVALAVLGYLFVHFAGYRVQRIVVWRDPVAAGDSGYQTLMGLYAIGSGGFFGKGLGNSLQKLGNIPEAQNDMIFSVICEELGLFGAICVLLLFAMLIWRMSIIARNARDLYRSLLVVGVMAHIAIQVVLNIAVVTNIIPNTGVILPFISYGGTSVVFLMIEIGLVLNVSKTMRKNQQES